MAVIQMTTRAEVFQSIIMATLADRNWRQHSTQIAAPPFPLSTISTVDIQDN